MHVPAYPPVEEGVHEFEYSGVVWELVKTIIMLLIEWSILVCVVNNDRPVVMVCVDLLIVMLKIR